MNKFWLFLLIIICSVNFCFASGDIFNHPAASKEISNNMPELKNASCKFTQEKHLESAVLKSGGNFKFLKDKGAVFETLYPIKSTVSYTSAKNKQINEIMKAVSNKNFAYLDKNFNLYFSKENDLWTVGLKPKKDSAASSQLHDIIIKGKSDIKFIKISTIKNGTTEISFQQCTTN